MTWLCVGNGFAVYRDTEAKLYKLKYSWPIMKKISDHLVECTFLFAHTYIKEIIHRPLQCNNNNFGSTR